MSQPKARPAAPAKQRKTPPPPAYPAWWWWNQGDA